MGLDYNLCIRQLLTRLWEIANLMNLGWENNFKARVIEQCTAVSENDTVVSMNEYKKTTECDLLTDISQWKTNIK